MPIPPGAVAQVGARMAPRDRAALACAARAFAAAHDAVDEADCFPLDRGFAFPKGPAADRVARLVRAMPALRTLRVGQGQHEHARAFLEGGGDRRVRFACLLDYRGEEAEVARAFPGRVSAATVYLTVDVARTSYGDEANQPINQQPMARLIGSLSSVGCLNICVQRMSRVQVLIGAEAEACARRLEAGARRLVAALPWSTIRSVQIECAWAEETVALLRAVGSPVVGLRCSSGSLPSVADVLPALRSKHVEHLERLHVDLYDGSDCWLGGNLGVRLVMAMPTIAALPPRCALSVPASLCESPMAVQLLRAVLSPSPEGGRRARVEVVYGSDDALKRLHVHAAVACASSRAGDIVTVDACGRDLDPQPDRDREAALRRLRALSLAGAFVADAWKGASPLRNPHPGGPLGAV